MKQSNPCYLPKFSHIYAETEALAYPLAQKILEKLKSPVIEIQGYKDIFSRSGQNFQEQKKSLKLVLAVKKDNFLYEGSEAAPDFGYKEFYYNTPALNCVYNCDYCYLQGMYPSANIVIFVNIEDFFDEIRKKLTQDIYVCISYDTDLLAMQNTIPLASEWIQFASDNPGLLLELRTKSAGFKFIRDMAPADNIILAWTLSPDEIIERYEKRTPRLNERLNSMKEAIEAGWRPRICIDPILAVPGWEKIYTDFIRKILTELPPEKIRDIALGTFRMNSDFLKKIRKQREDSDILFYPYSAAGSVRTYGRELEQKIRETVLPVLQEHFPAEKIVFTGAWPEN